MKRTKIPSLQPHLPHWKPITRPPSAKGERSRWRSFGCRDCLPDAAVAIPVRNEATRLGACLAALDMAASRYPGRTVVVLLLNGCNDASLDIVQGMTLRNIRVDCRLVSLLPGNAHVGWARRLAFDAAIEHLCDPADLLLSTDADTEVDLDWISRNAAYLCSGYDAVAGKALIAAHERVALSAVARRRVNLITRYQTALDWLRSEAADPDDPWPRHYYEGGASMALTVGAYRRIGGAPTPPFAEDRALFDHLRAVGARVRHPRDVCVFTSCRIQGRAQGGMADTLAGWMHQSEDDPVHEIYKLDAALESTGNLSNRLTFRTLPSALADAQRLIAQRRASSGATPQIETVSVMGVRSNDAYGIAQQSPKLVDGAVAGLGIIGLAGPMDEEDVAA